MKIVQKMITILLSLALILPYSLASATGNTADFSKLAIDMNQDNETVKDQTEELFDLQPPKQELNMVASSVYENGELENELEQLKNKTLAISSTTSEQSARMMTQSFGPEASVTTRNLTKEEIDELVLAGAGIKDLYWVNLIIKESDWSAQEIYEFKKKNELSWNETESSIMLQSVGSENAVKDAVYKEYVSGGSSLFSSMTVQKSVYDPASIDDLLIQDSLLEKSEKSFNLFASAVDSSLKGLVTQQMINQTNKPQFADNYGSSEAIDPVTGSLTWKENEISLPGRDGLDLNIGIMYNSNQSFSYMRSYLSEKNIKKYNYLVSRYDLGLGWSFQFPSVQSEDGYLFYHDGQGAVYRVDFNAGDALGSYTHLAGYQGKDLQFNQDNGTFNNGQDISAYYLQYDSQKREYFAFDGRLLGIVDRYGNTIKFQHIDRVTYEVKPNEEKTNKVISSIVDSLGRIINFDYETNLNTTDIYTGEKITVSVITNGIETESVKFTKMKSTLTFDEKPDGYAPVLSSITNQNNESTYFGYDSSNSAKFNYNQKEFYSNGNYNSYLRLTKVNYPNLSTLYEYQLSTRNLGSSGLGEEYRISSRNDFIKTSFNKESYTYTGDYTGYPLYADTSYLPVDYKFSSTKTMQSTSPTNGLATTITFNGNAQNILISTLASNGERKERRNTAFHPIFKYLPTHTTYAEISAGGNENLLYSEVSYTDWGALQSETKQLTSSQFNDATIKSKYTTTYDYEPSFHLLKTKSWFQNSTTLLTESYTYNEYGRVKTYTNPKNETTNYFYENSPADVKIISKIIKEQPMENGLVSRVSITYGSGYNYGFPTEEESSLTNISSTGQKTASSTYKKMSYDMGSGKVIEEVDAADKKTRYAYDQLGRVKTITYPTFTNLKGEKYDSEDQYTYTRIYASLYKYSIFDEQNQGEYYLAVNSKRKYTQKSNGVVTYLSNVNSFYDGFGSLRLEQTLDTSAITQYHLDDLGRAVYVIDPVGNETTLTFDSWGQQVEAKDSSGNVHFSYDNWLRRETTNFIVGASDIATYRSNPSLRAALETSYVKKKYDQWGQIISSTSYKNWPRLFPMVQETFSYDFVGNLIAYLDPSWNKNSDGVTTNYEYDSLNRLTSVKDALDQITNYQYDINGQNTQTTMQSNATSTPIVLKNKEYNELGLLANKKDASSQNENKTYNTLGLVQKSTDRNGTVFENQYDEIQRSIHSTITNSAGDIQESNLIVGINGIKSSKNELSVKGVTSSQTATIDSINRVSLLTSTATGYSASTSYVYDKSNHITQLKSTLGGLSSFYTNYQYNKARLEKIQTDGSSTLTNAASANIRYEYFPTGKVKSITYPTLADGSILKTTYTYDGLNQISSIMNEKGGSILSRYNYYYDDNGNVISVVEAIDNGRENTSFNKYDKLNRLISIKRQDGGEAKYTYDLLGNRQTVSDTSTISNDVADTLYTYDLQNTLIGVNKNTSSTSFNYLPNKLRYQKKKNTVTTQYNYNNLGQVISEISSGGEKVNYIRGDRLLVKKDVAGAHDYYYLYNGHGDVVQIVDTNGKVLNSYSYDAWGNITNQDIEIPNSFKYAGEIYDEDTGLYYLRARYYDPSIGRFINEDTYEGQINNPLTLNLYTYVLNNPFIYSDPSGNKAWLIHGTFSYPTKSWGDDNSVDKYIEGLFNESSERVQWSGGNSTEARSKAADELFKKVYEWHLENLDEPIRLIGHSHGGNVAIMAANLLAEKGVKVETLITIATPVREYHLDKNTSVGQYIHVYNNKDQIQKNGGPAWTLGNTYSRKFKGAQNVRAKDAEKPGIFSPKGGPVDSHSNMHNNIDIWKKYIEPILKK